MMTCEGAPDAADLPSVRGVFCFRRGTVGSDSDNGRCFVSRPGLDFFWEQADRDGSGEHPLERELCERLDALARYRGMIADAEANGREEAAELLLGQQRREAEMADRIREAMGRMGGMGGMQGMDGTGGG